MELQEFAWLCLVALFLASLLIVLTWLLQYLQSALRLWRARKTAGSDRGAPARQPLCFTLPHHSPGGGVWGFLRKLRPGRDGGAAAEAGVKGLFTSLFSFKSFREHWQRTWVKALNEQACRHGSSIQITFDSTPQLTAASAIDSVTCTDQSTYRMVLHCNCWVDTVTFPVTVTQQSPAAVSMDTYQISIAPRSPLLSPSGGGVSGGGGGRGSADILDSHQAAVIFSERVSAQAICLEEEKPEPRPALRPRLAAPEPVCSSPSAASIVSSARATTPREWAPGLPCTWRPCWSTSPLRSWSWLETPPETTRSPASSPVTCSWRSATTRSSTSCSAASPSPRAASCPTSRPSCCPRRPDSPHPAPARRERRPPLSPRSISSQANNSQPKGPFKGHPLLR